MNATPIGWRVQIGTGIALAGMAVAACTVDVLNNRDYGLSFSEEAATVLMIAAIGVVAIPAAAGVMGWTIAQASRHCHVLDRYGGVRARCLLHKTKQSGERSAHGQR